MTCLPCQRAAHILLFKCREKSDRRGGGREEGGVNAEVFIEPLDCISLCKPGILFASSYFHFCTFFFFWKRHSNILKVLSYKDPCAHCFAKKATGGKKKSFSPDDASVSLSRRCFFFFFFSSHCSDPRRHEPH